MRLDGVLSDETLEDHGQVDVAGACGCDFGRQVRGVDGERRGGFVIEARRACADRADGTLEIGLLFRQRLVSSESGQGGGVLERAAPGPVGSGRLESLDQRHDPRMVFVQIDQHVEQHRLLADL